MSWTVADIPDQSGRTAVITGANGGLGLETARALAGAGAHVVMAARNQQKAEAARAGIAADVDGASLEIVPLDLGSLASVRAAADAVVANHDRLDLLVNNAGLMAVPEGRTEDGFELQLGVNHLGHWALTAHLLPTLASTPGSRVVTVTSTAHHFGRAVDPGNPHLQGTYGPWKAYGQSKLANFHFGLGLQRELEAAGAETSSLIAHPGLTDTDLQAQSVEASGGRPVARFFHRLAGVTGMSPAQGALPQVRAAADPTARGGEFYAPRFGNNGPPVKRPVLRRMGLDRAIDRLWAVSEEETGIALRVTTD